MAQPPLYVVDASVAGRWYLRGETSEQPALEAFRDYQAGHLQFLAPSHIWYEVASILSKAVGQGRLQPEDSRQGVRAFFGLRIPVVHSRELIESGFEISMRLQCSLYDATYLALADLVGSPFLYADERLRRTLRDRHPRALWVDDYRSPEL